MAGPCIWLVGANVKNSGRNVLESGRRLQRQGALIELRVGRVLQFRGVCTRISRCLIMITRITVILELLGREARSDVFQNVLQAGMKSSASVLDTEVLGLHDDCGFLDLRKVNPRSVKCLRSLNEVGIRIAAAKHMGHFR
jgi:hypothetical protein